jgi:hypothetical protein
VPPCVGVPLILTVLAVHNAVTPSGRPVAAPIPIAPVVARTIGVSGVLMQRLTVDSDAATVFVGFTMMVPVADTVPQPPVKGIL